ncbi:MAG: PAS domain-containing protein [Patescibacteria group bacterium]|nr:PAS domain-containing protein [Patescibacteria group bacterium]
MKKKEGTPKKSDRETALYYISSFCNTAREPFLILNPDLRVVAANTAFYKIFQVAKEGTENQLIYDLGNGQWNIPELRRLLENILPQKKSLNDFEVTHEFPNIGLKIMILNARQLDATQQILLAIEDITLKKTIEKKLADYTKNLEKGIAEKTAELEARVDELSKLNKLMVGRELKMVELKKEIKQLKN